MTATPQTTIREIVASDYRTAAVFERYGLDYCCNGARTIAQGCRDGRVDEALLLRELDAVLSSPSPGGLRFDAWDARALIDYIVDHHHGFVRQALPVLLQHTAKIAGVHGGRHPELVHIANLFVRIASEMTSHMAKEEQVLFPFIGALEDAAIRRAPRPSAPFGTVANPIQMMETEHEFVGDAMAEIRHLTQGYTAPPDACTTYGVCLQELETFERDLHQHVHLENNLLFPKAAALEAARS
jgi:regulator of cell morphogenesis and NO signaling